MAAMAQETNRTLQQKKAECMKLMQERQNDTGPSGLDYSDWCPVAWDDIMCWDRVEPDSTEIKQCPDYIHLFTINGFAVRTCTSDGTWEMHPTLVNKSWTNYTACMQSTGPFDLHYHAELGYKLAMMYTVGYSFSLAALIIATFIMFFCRRLQCKSNTMHINLFLAFILRASFAFLKDKLFVGYLGLGQDVTYVNGRLEFIQEGLHWECRLITVLFMFSISATQAWILMEGLYLYMLIHFTMVIERHGVRPYIIIGWALPWAPVLPWIVIKSMFENTFCWNFQQNPGYFWILSGPWFAFVMINFFFFLDIFRVLFTRVRNNYRHSGNSKYRKFAKFILVLIPLFGIFYIVIFVYKSAHEHDGYNVPYLYIEMGYNSFQGFILALLFCFLNEDVHSELRRLWRRHRTRRQDSNYFRHSAASSTFRQKSRESNSRGRNRALGVESQKRETRIVLASTAPSTYPRHLSSADDRRTLCKTQSSESIPVSDHCKLYLHKIKLRPSMSNPMPPVSGDSAVRKERGSMLAGQVKGDNDEKIESPVTLEKPFAGASGEERTSLRARVDFATDIRNDVNKFNTVFGT